MQSLSLESSNSKSILIAILTFAVFSILSTELGAMGLIPILQTHFAISAAEAGWAVSIFALMITLCAPIVPLLCAGFNQKTLMLLCLAVFSIASILAIFVTAFWQFLVLRAIMGVFHPIYCALALSIAAKSARNPKDAPKEVAKVFAGVSAGMVLGVPMASFLGGNVSYEAAQGFFALLTGLSFVLTLFFIPNTDRGQKPHLKEQVSIVKEPLLWLSMLFVILVQAAVFGFYGYLSDFLHKVTELNFTYISIILAIYGGTNIVGNILAGKALSKNANKSVVFSMLFMSLLYVAIFVEAQNALLLSVLIFILGILAGLMNNAVHFILTEPFPKQAEFVNGIFLSVANIGLSLGTIICGYVADMINLKMIALSACVLLVLGFVTVALRSKIKI